MIVCGPIANPKMSKEAVPPDRATVLFPGKGTPLSSKTTYPVGVPEAGATGLTLAVKVTDWPKAAGFPESAMVVEAAPSTVWESMAEVPTAKLPSPLYTAETEWLPRFSDESEKTAVPPTSGTVLLPGSATPPSSNVTVPVGVPEPGASGLMVAVKVTGLPNIDVPDASSAPRSCRPD